MSTFDVDPANLDLERDEYVALSGGVTRLASRNKVYVVRASGSVMRSPAHFWLRTGHSVDIRPGDTVVVQLDSEREPALPTWQSITKILNNVAIAATAIRRLRR